jgi:hypothetical protein
MPKLSMRIVMGKERRQCGGPFGGRSLGFGRAPPAIPTGVALAEPLAGLAHSRTEAGPKCFANPTNLSFSP